MSDVKIFARNLEEQALKQVDTLSKQEAFKNSKIRIMPDGHSGKGCVIGFTSTFEDKICPNLIGVDIGCGLYAVNVPKIDREMIPEFDDVVNRVVPSGFNLCNKETFDVRELNLTCVDHLKNIDRLNKSAGTLGGGNHFVEVDSDGDTDWIVVHSGSRNLGLQIAQFYQNVANDVCDDDVPKDLKYLQGLGAESYLRDMKLAQEFAVINRKLIIDNIIKEFFGENFKPMNSFSTIHNYIGNDDIIRKGAVSAKDGELLIIPLNMRDGAIIGRGKGNEDWNFSAPHGSGRKLSRKKANDSLNLEEFEKDMRNANIYSTSVCKSTLDEAPGAYKDSNQIIELIEPTVEIEKIVKPVYNFKAH